MIMKQQFAARAIALAACLSILATLGGCGAPSGAGHFTERFTSEATETERVTAKAPAGLEETDSRLSDGYLLYLVERIEIPLREKFIFHDSSELSESQLYLAFLALTDEAVLEQCKNKADQNYYFTKDLITAQLQKYFQHFEFDITKDSQYDKKADAIVTPIAQGFGGVRNMKMESKSIEGNTVTFTVSFHEDYHLEGPALQTKTYVIEFYDGGYYYLSAF